MFFSTAYSSAGQFLKDGSTIFTRRSVADPSATTQCQTGPRHASTRPNAWPPAGRSGSATRVGPSGVRAAAARIRWAASRASSRRTIVRAQTIARRVDGDSHLELGVGGEGCVAPAVRVDSARAPHEPHDLQLARGPLGQPPGALQALEHHRVVEGEARDLLELGGERLDGGRDLAERRACDRAGDATRHDGAAQQPVAGGARVQPTELLADPETVRVAEGEAGVVDDHADVGDVVVEPFELEEDDAEPARARRNLAAGKRLERLAVREPVAGTLESFVAGQILASMAAGLVRQEVRFTQPFAWRGDVPVSVELEN